MSDWPQALPVTTAGGNVISTLTALRGMLATSPAAAAWPAANRAYFIPFTLPRPVIACKMVFGNGTTAGGNVDMGIFDRQGNKIISSGAVGRTASSEVVSDITDTLIPAGAYYLGMSHDGTSNIVALATPLQSAKLAGVLSMSSAYTLPDPVTFAALADAYIPSFAVYTRPY